MGTKVNPIGLRLGITQHWKSQWYVAPFCYMNNLTRDLRARDYISHQLTKFGSIVGSCTLKRTQNKLKFNVQVAPDIRSKHSNVGFIRMPFNMNGRYGSVFNRRSKKLSSSGASFFYPRNNYKLLKSKSSIFRKQLKSHLLKLRTRRAFTLFTLQQVKKIHALNPKKTVRFSRRPGYFNRRYSPKKLAWSSLKRNVVSLKVQKRPVSGRQQRGSQITSNILPSTHWKLPVLKRFNSNWKRNWLQRQVVLLERNTSSFYTNLSTANLKTHTYLKLPTTMWSTYPAFSRLSSWRKDPNAYTFFSSLQPQLNCLQSPLSLTWQLQLLTTLNSSDVAIQTKTNNSVAPYIDSSLAIKGVVIVNPVTHSPATLLDNTTKYSGRLSYACKTLIG